VLNGCTDAHHEEEATDTGKVSAATKAPHANPMQDSGCEKGAKDHSKSAKQKIEGTTAKVDKVVAEELVPS
jgi:hypothetical protein